MARRDFRTSSEVAREAGVTNGNKSSAPANMAKDGEPSRIRIGVANLVMSGVVSRQFMIGNCASDAQGVAAYFFRRKYVLVPPVATVAVWSDVSSMTDAMTSCQLPVLRLPRDCNLKPLATAGHASVMWVGVVRRILSMTCSVLVMLVIGPFTEK